MPTFVQLKRTEIAVLIPACNEAPSIRRVVAECLHYSNIILVVNDGSSDETGDISKNAGAMVLSNSVRKGYGAALRRGFKKLRQMGYANVVTLDADGVHDPAYIPQLLKSHVLKGADLTIGSRFMRGRPSRYIPSPKVAANNFATILTNKVLGCKLSDAASGMRVISQRLFSKPFTSQHFGFAVEIIAAAIREGFRINESPIGVRYNAEELFVTSQKELLNLLDFAIALSESRPPLRTVLEKIREKVINYDVLHISMDGNYLVVHPIREYDGFVFQRQMDWHIDLSSGGLNKWLEIP